MISIKYTKSRNNIIGIEINGIFETIAKEELETLTNHMETNYILKM